MNEDEVSHKPNMTSAGAARQSFYFQFVTTPTVDTLGTTLILHFNNQRYVFGRVGEGTQRAFIERGIGLRKVQNVFLTGTSGRHGGLLGMLLTTADVHAAAQLSSEVPLDRARFNIHGPPGTAHMLASARRFIFRTGMPLSVHEYGVTDEQRLTSEPTWTDENIQVWALPCLIRNPSKANDSHIENESDLSTESSTELPVASRASTKQQREARREDIIQEQQRARHSIIQDMFDSDWRHDRLVEAEFRDVNLPAKIHIRDPITKTLEFFNCATMLDAPHLSPSTKVLVRQPWPGSRWEALPSGENLPKSAVSYIVRGHTQRGVFEKAKAIALGLKPGPEYSKLVAGESVLTNDGRLITPDMVLGPAKSGRGIAIIDIPDVSFITDFLDRPEWSDKNIMAGIDTFCWIIANYALEDPRIQDFIRSRSQIHHIFASTSACPNYLAMEASAASTIRLSRISGYHFPVPVHDNARGLSQIRPDLDTAPTTKAGLPGRAAERGLTIQIEPRYQVQEQQVVPFLNTYKVIQQIPAQVLDLARKVPQVAHDGSSLTNGVGHDPEPEIICLGTGSAVPSKYRNVSATLLKMPGYGYYLFDCGENTIGQLRRFYSEEALVEVLGNMRMIWISHLHADHHLGTLALLEHIQMAQKALETPSPFALVADEAMIDFVNDMESLTFRGQYGGDMDLLVCCSEQPLRQKLKTGELLDLDNDYLSTALHIRALQTTWVSHCAGAQAVSIEFTNGFKISYSGDCRPSKNFAFIGRDSDVLIHEATFEDGMEGDALAKKHSTTSEALGVAAQMRAKNVILTHFSQRYQKIPVMTHIKPSEQIQFEEGAEEIGPPEPVDHDTVPTADILMLEEQKSRAHAPSSPSTILSDVSNQMNVCVAFDLMRTRVSQIKNMHKFYPAIEALFESQQKVDSEATAKEKAEAINRSKVKGKKDSNSLEVQSSKKGEKRKSDSDGEAQRQGGREQMSKRALRRLQNQKLQHEQKREKAIAATKISAPENSKPEEMKTSPSTLGNVASTDPVGGQHLDLPSNADVDLPFNADSEMFGAIMDITSSRAEADKNP
jgi:ribonuclease Z